MTKDVYFNTTTHTENYNSLKIKIVRIYDKGRVFQHHYLY
jgi:hypothetical protein